MAQKTPTRKIQIITNKIIICPWHRKASAKTQVSLTKFLQSEVKIIHIIVQNNTYYSARSRWTKQQHSQ